MRARRGVDVGSDHHIVTANIKLKLMQSSSQCRIKRFDTDKLKVTKTKQDFKLELKNRFQTLQNIETEEVDDEHCKM